VVAQEGAPLAARRDGRGVGQDRRDARPGRLAEPHVEPRHHREVEGQLAFVVVAEVLDHIGRPLVGFAQQDPPRVFGVDQLPHLFEDRVGAGQVLAVGAVLLDQVGDGVEPEPVDAEVHPEPDGVEDLLLDPRVLVVEVGLMGEEPVPVVLPADLVVTPVGADRVDEDDPRVQVGVRPVAPDVEVTVGAGGIAARGLEPRVVTRGVVHDEVDDHLHAAGAGPLQQRSHVVDRAELGQHPGVVGHVVPAVAQW